MFKNYFKRLGDLSVWIIIEQENHPDRFITDVYGPFEDDGKALEEANRLENEPLNLLPGYGYKRSTFYVRQLTEITP